MKKSLFARILILILCLSLVLCGCNKASEGGGDADSEGGGGSGKSQSAGEKVVGAFGDTLSAIFADGASTDVIEDALKTGKITITVGDEIENVLYINSEKELLADELKMNMDGVELNAELYLNEEALIVALPDILDDAYGVNLNTLMKDLKGSYIWEMMGTDYETAIGELESGMGDVTALMDQFKPVMEGLETAVDSALKCVDSSVTQGTVTVDGQDVEATIVTYSFGNEELKKIVDIIFDYVEDYSDVLTEMGGDMGDMIEEMEGAREEAKAALDEVEIDFNLVTNINADNGCIMTIDGTLKAVVEGEEMNLKLDGDFGVNPADSDNYTLILSAVEDGETYEMLSMVMDRTVSGSDMTYDMVISAEGYEVFSAELEYNTDSSAYSLTLDADGDTVSVNGTYKLTDDYFEFSVGTINTDGYDQEINVKVVIEAISAGEIPKAPSYTNILTMSEDKWMDLAEKLQNFAG